MRTIYTDPPWLQAPYDQKAACSIMGALKGFLPPQEDQENAVRRTLWEQMATVLFNQNLLFDKVPATSLQTYFDTTSALRRYDALLLAIILALCSTENLAACIDALLSELSHTLMLDERIVAALTSLKKGDIKTLQDPSVLGEGFHNQMARLNGFKAVGWFEYQKQMTSMKKGKHHLKLQAKYAFLNELPEDTLGGCLTRQLRQEKLSLPGEKFGFAEFFLWHDLSHALSGNGTNWAGELGANIFTAAYSKRGKFSILLWGLMQFNLGIPLAVVATPSKNNFGKISTIQQYLHSLKSGCHTTLDPLDWPLDVMISDMKMPLDAVRRKYHIRVDF